MSDIKIRARLREEKGKGAAKTLRRAGLVPAILYAKGYSRAIALDSKEFLKAVKNTVWSTTILRLHLDGESNRTEYNVMIKDHQVDPILGQLLHADFYEISMDKLVSVKVPIIIKGEAQGLESGGVLVHILSELEIECLPSIIPHQIEADVSNLEVGQLLHVADLKLNPQIKILNNLEEPIVSIAHPSAIETPPVEILTSPDDQTPEE